ncbi:hypothetical protein [Aestuariispira insulae]|nr:hypothetical protein [Aestuariispira insulae]
MSQGARHEPVAISMDLKAWSALNTVCVPGLDAEGQTMALMRDSAEKLTGRPHMSAKEKAAEQGLYLTRSEAWKYDDGTGSFLIAVNLLGRSKCAVIARGYGFDPGQIIEADSRYYFVSQCPVYLPRQRRSQAFRLYRSANDYGVLAASFEFGQANRRISGWIVARFDDMRAGDDDVRDYCQYVQRII